MSYSLLHFAPVKSGNAYIGDWTHIAGNWRRTIHDRYGFKLGSFDWVGSQAEKLWFFTHGLQHELRERSRGRETWRGLVVEMELTYRGTRWMRSVLNVRNWIKALYSSIGDNLLTNGGGESGVWTAFSTPTTLEQSTTWRTEGSYSIHIVGNSDGDGAFIQENVTIAAHTAYTIRVALKNVSGGWRLKIVEAADHGKEITRAEVTDTGESILQATIAETNAYSGNVDVFVRLMGSSGEAYFDGAIFQRGAFPAESNIYEDTNSQKEFGRLEQVLLRGALTTAAANAAAETYLRAHAWPRSLPAIEMGAEADPNETRLLVSLAGYGATLNWRHAVIAGTDTCSNRITDLVAGAEFVTAGRIEPNAVTFQIEQTAPMKVLDLLQQIADVGDSGTAQRWSIGVFENRKLNYTKVAEQVNYRYRGGKLYTPGNMLVEPWNLRPGWVYLDDAPGRAGFAGSTALDSSRVLYMPEVEFIAPNGFRPGFNREDVSEE